MTSAVVCHDCPTGEKPGKPNHPGMGHNSTMVPVYPTGKPTHGGEHPVGPGATPTAGSPSEVPTAGAGKVAALSGAGLAAVVGLAAFL
ncbi:hypothetical protein HG531_007903 [Fusarium graminearum]|nr:hypothetical protein HG531_007903 [Fusarium graminearum]